MKKKIVILGAGITGLSAAKFLKEQWKDDIELKVIEKQKRTGGWIETQNISGCLFEMGARSCRTKGQGRLVLQLVESLGLQQALMLPSKEAKLRFIYTDQGLKQAPKHLWNLPFNELTPGFLKVLWRDWTAPKRVEADESIASFFRRRMGKSWEILIDALTVGVFAGDYTQLSIKSCFPLFDSWEEKSGSLLRGALTRKPRHQVENQISDFVQSTERSQVFSFRAGMQTLCHALTADLEEHILLGKEVQAIWTDEGGQITIQCAGGETMQADGLLSTLPAHSLCDLRGLAPNLREKLGELQFSSVVIVNMAWKEDLLKKKGFGFLIPSKQRLEALGVVFDSCVFPEQNEAYATRLGVMLGGVLHPEIVEGKASDLLSLSQKIIAKELGILQPPDLFYIHRAKKAIPQFNVGFHQWKEDVLKLAAENHRHLFFSGSSFCGVSIGDCISDAKRAAEEISHLFFCKK